VCVAVVATIGVFDRAATAYVEMGFAGFAGDDAKPSAPKLAPMAIVAETRLMETAVAAAMAVFLCIVGLSRSLLPSIGDVRSWVTAHGTGRA
jgi:hypothetical protein